MKMTTEELKAKLAAHKLWLETRMSDEIKGERLDLTGANLRSANLYGANLRSANLAGANLRSANLADADLADADLADADLTGANLRSANLADADLTGANPTGANLRSANLTGANLYGANLRNANLRDANLTGADLRNANLRDANLTGADLYGADLTGADLTGADLDYSAWSLKCSSLKVKINKRLAAQLMYHTMRVMLSCKDDASVAAVLASPECVALANQFHRVNECGRLEVLSSESKAAKKPNRKELAV